MKLSLRTKFVLAIIVVEFVMLTIMVLNNQRIVKESNYKRVTSRISLIMELFSMNIARNLLEEYLVQEQTERVGQELEIAYAAVEDPNGKIIAHTDKHMVGAIAKVAEEKSLEEATDGIYDASMPVVLFGNYLGRVRIGFSTVQLNRDIANARNQGVLIAGIQLLLGILVAFFLGWYLTRHLAILTYAVKSMASGKLYQRVEFKADDEIKELGNAFNEMALALQKLYHELEEKIIELKSLDDLKDDFLNTVSHDLSTPVATIIGYVSILERKEVGALNPNQAKYLNAVKNACKYLIFLVENLLTSVRIEAKKSIERKAVLSLLELLKEVQELFNPAMEDKDITFSIESPCDYMIEGDKGGLKQVFSNLLSNAIKFTSPHGTVKIEVAGVRDDTIRISIIDSGRGIPKEKIASLFNKFVRYGDEKGMGLGLYISKKIVEAHGGEIAIESEISKGTRATFTLKREAEKKY